MAVITLRVLDGSDRGREFAQLSTPVTIGREEGNSVQLNDERVSRFHLKIQEDNEQVVLTDLESTNGTKVNGEDVQLRILRYGDVIAVGRSVILFGSRDEIAGRLARLRRTEFKGADGAGKGPDGVPPLGNLEFEMNWADNPHARTTFQSLEPPELPQKLGPGQAAQLSELLEYLHMRVRDLLATVKCETGATKVTLDERKWQNLVDLQSRLATYLRQIGEPRDE